MDTKRINFAENLSIPEGEEAQDYDDIMLEDK